MIENATFNSPDQVQKALDTDFFKDVDARAREAFQYILMTPSLGPYVALDGRTALWSKLWDSHLTDHSTQGLAAAFGYVIETLVSHPHSPFLVRAPDGCTVVPQMASGGTRPDLVLIKGGVQVAWADLTASGSAGHILLKDSWARRIAIYAEVTYPSLRAEHLYLMSNNRDSTGGTDLTQVPAQLDAARARYRRLRAHWNHLGEPLRFSRWKPTVLASEGLATAELLELQPERKIPYILDLLRKRFHIADLDEATATNLLQALQVDPTRWGLLGSASVGAGESWLMANDEASGQMP